MALQEKMIRCGKPGCLSCPHGPYLYEYTWEGGRTKAKYIGKMSKAEYYRRNADAWEDAHKDNAVESRKADQVIPYFSILDELGLCDDGSLTREKVRKRVHNRSRTLLSKGAEVESIYRAFAELCQAKGWAAPGARTHITA